MSDIEKPHDDNVNVNDEPEEMVEPQLQPKKRALGKRVVRNFLPVQTALRAGGPHCNLCTRSR